LHGAEPRDDDASASVVLTNQGDENMATQYDYYFNGSQTTWVDVWRKCDASPAVESYDDDAKSIVWCDGSESTFVEAEAALNAIDDMDAS